MIRFYTLNVPEMLEMCWENEGLWSFITLTGFSQTCVMFLDRSGCAGWTPEIEQNLIAVLWTSEWLCQAKGRSSCTLIFQGGKIFPFSNFYKMTSASANTVYVQLYPQDQSNLIRKLVSRIVSVIMAFSNLDLILQNIKLVQHSAKSFWL